jgi:CRISPR-associated protein Cas5d
MYTKKYEVSMEIAGEFAMFTNPATGSAPVSYPGPTYSAVKGIFESIARFTNAYIRPTRVEICSPIKYKQHIENYNGPLRHDRSRKGNTPQQIVKVILINVCYKLYGEIQDIPNTERKPFNHLHALQNIFYRKLRQGKVFHTPFLGLKEFEPNYYGVLRDTTKIQTDINLTIPSMLVSPFAKDVSIGEPNLTSRFVQNVKIINGVLDFTVSPFKEVVGIC